MESKRDAGAAPPVNEPSGTDLEPAHITSVAEIAQATEAAPETMMAVAAMTPEALVGEAAAKEALAKASDTHREKQAGLPPFAWVTALVVIVTLVLWIFAGR